MVEQEERPLTGADVRGARNSQQPVVTQADLAKELGWYEVVMPPIENGEVEVSQAQLREMLAAIERVVKKRAEGKGDG